MCGNLIKTNVIVKTFSSGAIQERIPNELFKIKYNTGDVIFFDPTCKENDYSKPLRIETHDGIIVKI